MSNKKGFYKLYRGWMSHPVFNNGKRSPFSDREAWVFFIEKCSFAVHSTDVLGKKVKVEVGSFFTTKREICDRFMWTEHHYKTFINALEKEGMISTSTTYGKTQIFLCNYGEYQTLSPKNHQQDKEGNNKLTEKGDLKGNERYSFFRTQLISRFPQRRASLDVANTFRKLMTKVGKKSVCGNYTITEELFLKACDNYKQECQRNGTDPQYVKCPKTFVNGAFENYITAQTEEPKRGRNWTAF